MSASTLSKPFSAGALALTVAAAVSIASVICMTAMCALGVWNFDGAGHPLVNDFVSYWSAGRLTLQGKALAAYDPVLRHAAEIATVGHPFKDVIGWWYPPIFLFLATGLACLPYAIAFAVMNDATLLLHAGMTALITKRPVSAVLVALPAWAMIGMVHGQNQFLTAALVGGFLLVLERRPVLAGLLLGLLTYKPQLGLLFPVALAFGGYWRAFVWTCIGSLLWTALSGAIFGFDTLLAFVHSLGIVGNKELATNPDYLLNLQSFYGLARYLGFSQPAAWCVQLCLSLSCVAAVAGLWKSKVPFALKAAGLATAIPLATPYVWLYDLTLLSVALSFLCRQRGFDNMEWYAVGFAMVCGYLCVFGWHYLGLIACLSIGTLVLRRYVQCRPAGLSVPREIATIESIAPEVCTATISG